MLPCPSHTGAGASSMSSAAGGPPPASAPLPPGWPALVGWPGGGTCCTLTLASSDTSGTARQGEGRAGPGGRLHHDWCPAARQAECYRRQLPACMPWRLPAAHRSMRQQRSMSHPRACRVRRSRRQRWLGPTAACCGSTGRRRAGSCGGEGRRRWLGEAKEPLWWQQRRRQAVARGQGSRPAWQQLCPPTQGLHRSGHRGRHAAKCWTSPAPTPAAALTGPGTRAWG